MQLASVHTAIHTIFGATISVALGLAIKINYISDIYAPIGRFFLILCIVLLSEICHELIRDRKRIIHIFFVMITTIIIFLCINTDFSISEQKSIFVTPNPQYLFVATLMLIWFLTLTVTGFVRRSYE